MDLDLSPKMLAVLFIIAVVLVFILMGDPYSSFLAQVFRRT
jgi:hypothetical protein